MQVFFSNPNIGKRKQQYTLWDTALLLYNISGQTSLSFRGVYIYEPEIRRSRVSPANKVAGLSFHFGLALRANWLLHVGVIPTFWAGTANQIFLSGYGVWIVGSIMYPVRCCDIIFLHSNLFDVIVHKKIARVQYWLLGVFSVCISYLCREVYMCNLLTRKVCSGRNNICRTLNRKRAPDLRAL